MMRIVSIVVALLAGLASLLVSVCGGGFAVATGYNAIHAMLRPKGAQNVLAGLLSLLIFAAACAVGGGWAFWRCIEFIRREWLGRD